MIGATNDYLLDKKVKIIQGGETYKTSSDAVLLASMMHKVKNGAKILDVGSGGGSVSLCLAYRFKQAQIVGLEIQEKLVELAAMSAKANGFENLNFVCHDISKKTAPYAFCSFDYVITNPPYFKNGSVSPNESKAAAHNGENVSLPQWLKFCIKMLKPFGTLYLIERAEVLDEILSILYQKTGNIQVLPVYSKKAQKAKRVIVSAQKDSKAGLSVLPPLVVHDENGHTFAAEEILRVGKSYFEIDF